MSEYKHLMITKQNSGKDVARWPICTFIFKHLIDMEIIRGGGTYTSCMQMNSLRFIRQSLTSGCDEEKKN